jgi:hypothetical protein
MPATDPCPVVEPSGLTRPDDVRSPTIRPPEIISLSLLLPQGTPTATTDHAPSNLPLSPSLLLLLFRAGWCGALRSGLLRRTDVAGRASRGAPREPDSDFSSFPILPPTLPDCAGAIPGMATMANAADSRVALNRN